MLKNFVPRGFTLAGTRSVHDAHAMTAPLEFRGGGKRKLNDVFPFDRHVKSVVAARGHHRNHRLIFGVFEGDDVAVLFGGILPEHG